MIQAKCITLSGWKTLKALSRVFVADIQEKPTTAQNRLQERLNFCICQFMIFSTQWSVSSTRYLMSAEPMNPAPVTIILIKFTLRKVRARKFNPLASFSKALEFLRRGQEIARSLSSHFIVFSPLGL